MIGGREELRERAVEGWDRFDGHTPHRPWIDEVKIACPTCGAPVERIKDVGNPWLDAGIVPFSTLHYREDPDYWARWFPADFITESFPGQFRNWFYSMLAMSTVLRREPPFKTIFGYALVFGEDGRPMHKSWGNAIDFDEAAERMGVDVMRWMFAKARPEENILFGWHAADEARRELLDPVECLRVLRDVRATGRMDAAGGPGGPLGLERNGPRSAGSCPARPGWPRRSGAAPATYDAVGAPAGRCSTFIDDLSTWYLRRSRDRMRAGAEPADRAAAFATLHDALVGPSRMLAPILPFLADAMYQNLVVPVAPAAPDSVHLTRLAGSRHGAATATSSSNGRWRLPGRPSSWPARCAARTGSRPASRWREPGSPSPAATARCRPSSSTIVASEINVKSIEPIADGSDLVERRVKVLLPKVGKRLGPAIPAVMAAAREGDVDVPRRRVGHARGRDARRRRGRGPGHAATRARPSRRMMDS